MEKKETISLILKNLKFGNIKIQEIGGQSCGIYPRGLYVESEDLGIRIEIKDYRSQLKARETLIKMIEFYINEQIK